MMKRRIAAYNCFDVVVVPYPFTLDHRHVIKKIGTLGSKDQKAFVKALQCLIPL